MVARLPFDGLGTAVLTNDDAIGDYMTFAIVSRLVDEALGVQPEEWKTRWALPVYLYDAIYFHSLIKFQL